MSGAAPTSAVQLPPTTGSGAVGRILKIDPNLTRAISQYGGDIAATVAGRGQGGGTTLATLHGEITLKLAAILKPGLTVQLSLPRNPTLNMPVLVLPAKSQSGDRPAQQPKLPTTQSTAPSTTPGPAAQPSPPTQGRPPATQATPQPLPAHAPDSAPEGPARIQGPIRAPNEPIQPLPTSQPVRAPAPQAPATSATSATQAQVQTQTQTQTQIMPKPAMFDAPTLETFAKAAISRPELALQPRPSQTPMPPGPASSGERLPQTNVQYPNVLLRGPAQSNTPPQPAVNTSLPQSPADATINETKNRTTEKQTRALPPTLAGAPKEAAPKPIPPHPSAHNRLQAEGQPRLSANAGAQHSLRPNGSAPAPSMAASGPASPPHGTVAGLKQAPSPHAPPPNTPHPERPQNAALAQTPTATATSMERPASVEHTPRTQGAMPPLQPSMPDQAALTAGSIEPSRPQPTAQPSNISSPTQGPTLAQLPSAPGQTPMAPGATIFPSALPAAQQPEAPSAMRSAIPSPQGPITHPTTPPAAQQPAASLPQAPPAPRTNTPSTNTLSTNTVSSNTVSLAQGAAEDGDISLAAKWPTVPSPPAARMPVLFPELGGKASPPPAPNAPNGALPNAAELAARIGASAGAVSGAMTQLQSTPNAAPMSTLFPVISGALSAAILPLALAEAEQPAAQPVARAAANLVDRPVATPEMQAVIQVLTRAGGPEALEISRVLAISSDPASSAADADGDADDDAAADPPDLRLDLIAAPQDRFKGQLDGDPRDGDDATGDGALIAEADLSALGFFRLETRPTAHGFAVLIRHAEALDAVGLAQLADTVAAEAGRFSIRARIRFVHDPELCPAD